MKRLISKVNEVEKEVIVENGKITIDDTDIEFIAENRYGYEVKIGDTTYSVDDIIDLPDEGIFRIEINGYTIDVKIEDPISKALAGAASGDGNVESPMSGEISDILVEEGDTVEQGEVLMIISAMKMENQINAPTSGVVASIKVKNNEKVSSGGLLVVIEHEEEA